MAMVLMHSSGTGVGCPPQESEYTQSAVDFLLINLWKLDSINCCYHCILDFEVYVKR
jgi:hypothetical protein